MSVAPRYIHRLPDRLDWYTLRAIAVPLVLALAVLLLAMILARLLKLFELAAATGASPLLVVEMIATLLPHYLGLALPAAFFAAIFMATARIGDDNELDAMLATGRSITRMAVPYFMVALALAGFNLYLFGFLQPLTRYGYNATAHEVRHTGWDARLEANRFVSVKDGYTLAADSVGADGRTMGGVFVERHDASGEQLITARAGRLVPSEDGARLLLELEGGQIVEGLPDGTRRTWHYSKGRINEDFTMAAPAFRPRGINVRELTLPELRPGAQPVDDEELTAARLAGEFHGRLARSVLPLLLPLLALPLGMAAKRGRRAPGTVFAALALVLLDQSLQFGEIMAEAGRAVAWVSVWLPVVVFGIFGLWLFRSSLQWPGDNPVMRAVSAIEGAFEGVQRRRKTGRTAAR